MVLQLGRSDSILNPRLQRVRLCSSQKRRWPTRMSAAAADLTVCEEIVLRDTLYQRYSDTVFNIRTSAVSWSAWSAYAEEEALEVLWSKVSCHDSSWLTLAGVLTALVGWKQLSCPQLFQCDALQAHMHTRKRF